MDNVAQTRSDFSVIFLFFAILAVIGVVGAGFIVNDYGRARASAAWPVHEGIILSSSANEHLRYVYSVGGKSYEGRRIRFFSSAPFQKTDKPGPGEVVRVYVDPKDASFSVLEPGGAGGFFAVSSIFLGLFVFLGVGGIVRTLTEQSDKNLNFHDGAQRA